MYLLILFKFPSFGLFDVTSMPSTVTRPNAGPSESENDVDMKSSHPETSAVERNWCTIRVNSVPGLLFKVCTVKPVFSHKELHGYNNTGNVQIWASEECMSMYCLENQQIFKGMPRHFSAKRQTPVLFLDMLSYHFRKKKTQGFFRPKLNT